MALIPRLVIHRDGRFGLVLDKVLENVAGNAVLPSISSPPVNVNPQPGIDVGNACVSMRSLVIIAQKSYDLLIKGWCSPILSGRTLLGSPT